MNPTGWPWFTLNGTPLACASVSGAVSVTGAVAADPTAVICPVSRLRPVSTKNGWPAVRFVAEATVTVVVADRVAALSVVIPAAGTLLANSNAVPPPAYCRTGVDRMVAEIVDGYGFSSMFESWTPPTLKPGMPRFQKIDGLVLVRRLLRLGRRPGRVHRRVRRLVGRRVRRDDRRRDRGGSGAEPVWL